MLSNAAKPEDIGNPRRGLADVRALPGPAYVDFTGSNLHVGLTPDPQGLAAYYLYNYQTVSTQEWIYLPVTIAPGQSQTYRENYQLEVRNVTSSEAEAVSPARPLEHKTTPYCR